MTGSEPRLRRRAFIGSAAALALGSAWRVGPLAGLTSSAPARAARPRSFARRLPIPRVLRGDALTIPMRQAEVQVLPGPKTRMWTYGGTFPGPTVRRPAGRTTRVRFEHRLPRKAGELTVHLHGGHNTAADDGQPGGLTSSQPRSLYCDISPRLSAAEAGNDLLIPPGGGRTYNYEGVEDGGPERASLQWYHDHRLDRTARNVWRGLAGMWILDDAFDSGLPLPRGARDLPLMICDRAFDRNNQLTNPFGAHRRPPDDGTVGRYVLVNGAYRPYHRVSARRYRLRLLNASHFRAYELRLGGAAMTQIATESGLMPAPVRRRTILLGPGERAEVIVDFARFRGKKLRLESVARRHGPDRLGSRTYEGPLMQFRVADKRVRDRTRVPATLRPLPGWVASAPGEPSHTWRMTVSGGFPPRWLLNGRTYDPAYADATVELGSVVTWRLLNRTSVAHLLHLHQTDWYLLSRNGQQPPPWERCLKETFFMDPGDELLVAGKLSDHTGKFVVHCHMLDHEDHGLMSQFEVVAPS